MAVPDYQELMLPMMRTVADGTDHKVVALVEALSDEYKLTDDERAQLLPSGHQRVIVNRTHWAATYLVKGGLLTRAVRGSVRLTDRGRQVLEAPPPRIDVKFLGQYPEFLAWRARTKPVTVAEPEQALQDPEELLDSTYAAVRRSVEADLLDNVLASSPEFFEQLVIELLLAMGYGGAQASEAARHVGRSGDDGIDGVIDEDKLGLDAIYIQAKRWAVDRPVRRPDLQAFAGSLEGQRATKGVFITTSRFTDDAREYVGRISRRIRLIDGDALARLMYDHGIGVRGQRTYDVRRVDTAYFEGEG